MNDRSIQDGTTDELVVETPARVIAGTLFLLVGLVAIGTGIYSAVTFEPTTLGQSLGVDLFRAEDQAEHDRAMMLFILTAFGGLMTAAYYFATGPHVTTVVDRNTRSIAVTKRWLGGWKTSTKDISFDEIVDTEMTSYNGRMFTDHALQLRTHDGIFLISGRTDLKRANDLQKHVRTLVGLNLGET